MDRPGRLIHSSFHGRQQTTSKTSRRTRGERGWRSSVRSAFAERIRKDQPSTRVGFKCTETGASQEASSIECRSGEVDVGGAEDEDEDEESTLLTSTGGILSSKKTQKLAKGVISIERLRDVNHSAPTEGAVKAIQFHPSPRIPVLFTAGSDRRLRLFNVCISITTTMRTQAKTKDRSTDIPTLTSKQYTSQPSHLRMQLSIRTARPSS